MPRQYATGADLLLRYDTRRVAELTSDTGVPTASPASSPVVTMALEDATAMLVSACRVANRYTDADLDALSSDSNAGPLIKRLVCNLAYGLLSLRRGYAAKEIAQLAPAYVEALQALEQLRRGDRILDSTPHATAGLPQFVEATDNGGTAFLSQNPRIFPQVTSTTSSPFFW